MQILDVARCNHMMSSSNKHIIDIIGRKKGLTQSEEEKTEWKNSINMFVGVQMNMLMPTCLLEYQMSSKA